MTIYYNSKKPIASALLVFSRATTFSMVFRNVEFWLYLSLHTVLVVLIREGMLDVDVEAENFDWNAIGATQFFMTFFITFYNGDCFKRFSKLYSACMDCIDSLQFFTIEVCVLMNGTEWQHHREMAVKYMLAALYVCLMGLTGGNISKAEWREITRKGLLTKHEVDILLGYPAAKHMESILVLAAWALKVVENGLEKAYAEKSMTMPGGHMKRVDQEVMDLLIACREVTTLLGLPIPFQYFHIMNAVLLTNLFIFSVASAFFKTYLTIVPVGISLYLFLGIRQISSAVSDPFGTEDHDYPVPKWLELVYNNIVSTLEVFHAPASWDCEYLLEKNEVFTTAQIRAEIQQGIFYSNGYDPQNSSPFAWSKEVPFQIVSGLLVSPHELLHHVIRAHDHPDFESDIDSEEEEGERDADKENTRQMFSTLRKVNAHLEEQKLRKAAEKAIKEEEANSKPRRTRKLEHLRRELNRTRKDNEKYEDEVLALRMSLDVLREKAAQMDAVRQQHRRIASKQAMKSTHAVEQDNHVGFDSFGEVRDYLTQLRSNDTTTVASFGMALPLRPIRERDEPPVYESEGMLPATLDMSPVMRSPWSLSAASPLSRQEPAGGRRGSVASADQDSPRSPQRIAAAGRRGSVASADEDSPHSPRWMAGQRRASVGSVEPPLPQSRRGSMASADHFEA